MEKEVFLYERKIHKENALNIWCMFPAVYNFGMAALGYLSIFKIFDKNENFHAERIFTDTEKTQIPFSDVDLIIIPFTFEMDFLQILALFEKYNIPFKAKDRDERYPLIFSGGPVMFANPEPYCEFFDVINIGDGEEVNLQVGEFIRNNKNLSKKEILEKLADINGLYIPHYNDNKPISKNAVDKIECLATPILTENSFFKNTYVIEIVRGCPIQCGFCLASYMNLPCRFANYEKIIENIDFGLKHTNKIALLGALILAHPQIEDICRHILEKQKELKNIELSVSSLRADYIPDIVIETLVKCGQKHSTIAIEAGSERLRKVINKKLSEEQILNTVKKCSNLGLKGLKCYAMIGLPTETKDDLVEMVELAKKMKNIDKSFNLTFSFSTFVPKAQTPFQFAQRDDNKTLEKKFEFLKKELHKIGIEIRISSTKWDYYQALLARGDRNLTDYLIDVYKNGGNLGAFKQVYKEYYKKGILKHADEYALNEIKSIENLPWKDQTCTKSHEFLLKEYKRLIFEQK